MQDVSLRRSSWNIGIFTEMLFQVQPEEEHLYKIILLLPVCRSKIVRVLHALKN